MFAVLERPINNHIESCKVKIDMVMRNLTDESICSKMPRFIGYSGKCNIRNAK